MVGNPGAAWITESVPFPPSRRMVARSHTWLETRIRHAKTSFCKALQPDGNASFTSLRAKPFVANSRPAISRFSVRRRGRHRHGKTELFSIAVDSGSVERIAGFQGTKVILQPRRMTRPSTF
jgi:hypothetical protein